MGRTAYKVKRGKLYQISYVNTLASPYIYKLKDIKSNKELLGWYYGRELARADLSDLDIETVIERKKTKDNRNLIYVKFKGLDESFNRWIQE